ncbi:NAD(P)-dependent oxidoreductase [Micromonospora sp. RTP1Z1]|uniref:NAD(P)-dependent oxidoreductase n=1 Tax=Micromonospora sp. RTP1Z1 TaxID=2994043 RepID=UPI0029C81F7A|nr:NAD(P)H-binding protein [Micromonospora sp. RTP1Z1]
MKLTIFGATGGIGRHLVNQAGSAGHDVTVVVRDPAKLAGAPVRVVAADLATADPETLRTAVGGADAVLSGLGPRSAADAGITARGTRAMAEAMAGAGVRRIVVVSAAPVGLVPSPGRPHPPRRDPGDGPLMRYVLGPAIRRVLRDHYADLALMEEELRDGFLDWTVVRPPRLTDKPLTGAYRTAYDRNVRGGVTISRADVAQLMLDLLDRPDSVRRTVGVAN